MPVDEFSMIGEILGHYQTTEKLGAGGIDEIYRAEHSFLMAA